MSSPVQRITIMGRAQAFEQLSLNTSTADSLTVPARAQSALVTPSGANIRWRCDGGSATSTVGHSLTDGETMEFFGGDLGSLSLIAASGTPTVAVTYYL